MAVCYVGLTESWPWGAKRVVLKVGVGVKVDLVQGKLETSSYRELVKSSKWWREREQLGDDPKR